MSKRIDFFYRVSKMIFILRELYGICVMPYYFHRTTAEQQALYAIGRTTDLHKKPVTNCDGENTVSKHQRWRAMDFVVVKDGVLCWDFCEEYNLIGSVAKALGLTWGGDWHMKDIYHVEDKDDET